MSLRFGGAPLIDRRVVTDRVIDREGRFRHLPEETPLAHRDRTTRYTNDHGWETRPVSRPIALSFKFFGATLAMTTFLAIANHTTPAAAEDLLPQHSAWAAPSSANGAATLAPADLTAYEQDAFSASSALAIETGYTEMSSAHFGTCDTGCQSCGCAKCADKKKAKKPGGAPPTSRCSTTTTSATSVTPATTSASLATR